MRADSSTVRRRKPSAEGHDEVVTQRPLAVADRAIDQRRHPGVTFDPTRRRWFGGRLGHSGEADVGHEIGEHDLLDAGLAERWQNPLDVAQEHPVRSDHEHTLVLQGEAMGVQQIGSAVEGDDRLAGSRPTLDDQHAGMGRADDLVLFGLDRGDDVTERAGTPALEGSQQCRSPRRPAPGASSPASPSSWPIPR